MSYKFITRVENLSGVGLTKGAFERGVVASDRGWLNMLNFRLC